MKSPDHRNFIFLIWSSSDHLLHHSALHSLFPTLIHLKCSTKKSSPPLPHLPHHSDMQGVLGRGEGGWIEWLTPDLSSFAMLSFSLLYSHVLYYAYTCYIELLMFCAIHLAFSLAFISYFYNFNHWRCSSVQYPWPLLCHALVFTSLLVLMLGAVPRYLLFSHYHIFLNMFLCANGDLSTSSVLSFSDITVCTTFVNFYWLEYSSVQYSWHCRFFSRIRNALESISFPFIFFLECNTSAQVDCHTQIICIWIFICSNTKAKRTQQGNLLRLPCVGKHCTIPVTWV